MTCVVCPVLRPKSDSRTPRSGYVCDGCRSHLRTLLDEVVEVVALLPGVYAAEPDTAPRDPVASALPTLVCSASRPAGRVSGSKEPPCPLDVDVTDLASHARVPTATGEDQVGELPAATVLDQWTRILREHRARGERLPDPTVAVLAGWLRVRVDDTCDAFPAVNEFAADLRHLAAALRRAARHHAAPLVDRARFRATPCNSCDALSLFRRAGGDYIECGQCGAMLRPDEYDEWVRLITTKEHLPWTRMIAARRRPREHDQ